MAKKTKKKSNRPSSAVARVTARKLQEEGLPGPAGTRIRYPAPGEAGRVGDLLKAAVDDLESGQVVEALAEGRCGTFLLDALDGAKLTSLLVRAATGGDLLAAAAELHQQVRVHDGLNPCTVAVILDSQSVKGAETVSQDTRGFDGGKLINGRKRHLTVDMRGMPLAVMVTPASPHDSVPARDQLFRLRLTHPELTVAWADSAYGGTLIDWTRSFLGITLKTVPRRKDQDGFAVLAKRWRVEQAISWIMRARRNVRDYERLVSHSEAHLTWTFITLMVRRLTRPPRPPRAAPHPVEPVKTADIPKPIRIRMQPPNSIRLAPAALR